MINCPAFLNILLQETPQQQPPASWRFFLLIGLFILIAFEMGLMVGAFFLKELHRLDSFGDALIHLHLMILGWSLRTVVVRQGRKDESNRALAKIGGPGHLAVLGDSAALLERAGAFNRVLGPGYYLLERFEVVRGAVDLRPYIKKVLAKAITKDGIPVQSEIEVEFQSWQVKKVPREGEPEVEGGIIPSRIPFSSTLNRLVNRLRRRRRPRERFRGYFTFSWWAVRNAIYNAPVMDGEVIPIEELVAADVTYQFQRLISRYDFNELIEPELGVELRTLPSYIRPRRELELRLISALRAPLRRWGCQINRLQIGPINPDEQYEEAREIISKRLERWQASELPSLKVIQAQGEAGAFRVRALARAQMEVQLLEQIAEGLEKAREVTRVAEGSEEVRDFLYTTVALTFLESLETLFAQSQEMGFFLIPHWVISCLNSLKKILRV